METKPSSPPPRLEQQKLSVASIFGEKTVKHGEAEEGDFIIEDDDKPPKL